MTTKIGSFEAFDSATEASPLAAITALLRGHVTEAVATWRQVQEQRRICAELAALNDRMLLDIGLTYEEIARLRAGDRFVPGRQQA